MQIEKFICANCKMYLCKSQNLFVQIAKCIFGQRWGLQAAADGDNHFFLSLDKLRIKLTSFVFTSPTTHTVDNLSEIQFGQT